MMLIYDGDVLALQGWINREGIIPPSGQAELREAVGRVLRKLADAQSTIDKLPKIWRLDDDEVVQDVPVHLKATIYREWYGTIEALTVDAIEQHSDRACVRQWQKVVVDVEQCAATREAAEALAKKAAQAAGGNDER
jgi:hypothetical protein